MRERTNPEVIDYLERENDYYKKMTRDTEDFKADLFEELKNRIKEEDNSVPYFFNEYWYITRYEKGKQYPIYTRKKDSLTAPEEILFDCNELAKGYDYFRLVGLNVSPDNTKVSYGIDTKSRRQYTLYVKSSMSMGIFGLCLVLQLTFRSCCCAGKTSGCSVECSLLWRRQEKQ